MTALGGRAAAAAVVLTAAMLASACSSSGTGTRAAAPGTAAAVATTTTVAPTTTSTSTTTTTLPVPPAPPITVDGLARGAKGDDVLALERRLIDLRFDPGAVDGTYDATTQHAVMAYQKAYGLPRTGRATRDVLDTITTAALQQPMMPTGGATRVEVDIARQVLMLWKDGQLFRVLSASTGSGKRYCVDGECARAVTPGGSFRVRRRINGWRTSRLGKLYNPLYFNGGIAIHGAPSVPAGPASHGCVRIPMYASYWFPQHVPNGTPVYVFGGPRAPVPFDEKAPGDEPAPTTTTTSTTAAPPLTPTIGG